MNFFFDSCQQLESQLQSSQDHYSSTDVETQYSQDKHDQISQTIEQENLIDENLLEIEKEKYQTQANVLKDEIKNLNFQLSTFIIQQTTTENVRPVLNDIID